jgi:hypothetical protein
LVAAIGVQLAIPIGAADEYDLTKWAYVNFFESSSGYFKIARDQAGADAWGFVARYPQWIRSQDSLHIGTHPPGLIVAQCLLLSWMERHPDVAGFLVDHMPGSTEAGFRQLEALGRRPLPRAERAALYATALLTLLACAGTVVPLYLLARAAMPARAAWAAAALWPLAPAANLFQPVADTAYPLLSTTALALAVWSTWSCWNDPHATLAGLWKALASGAVMAFGMAFSLAFLPVGLIAALVIGSDREVRRPVRIALIVTTGIGFLMVVLGGWLATRADPFVVWKWNLHHHARFYLEYPRTHSRWFWVNPIELAVAVGLPSAVWAAAGLFAPRSVPRIVWATLLVLVLVNLTGRNLGEVARLWMLFAPPVLVAAGHGIDRLGAGTVAFASSTALLGLQTLALQSMIQVVYPV